MFVQSGRENLTRRTMDCCPHANSRLID